MEHFSLVDAITRADPVVSVVMAVLAVASILVWTIAIERFVRLAVFRRRIDALEVAGPHAVEGEPDLVGRLREVAAAEARAPTETEHLARLEKSLILTVNAELRELRTGTSFLATVGSTAPFVGLFGTVWGIMGTFAGIAEAHDTSLAVVAPGIAEALFATAMGLVAAIPAVVFHNQVNVLISRISERAGAAIWRFARALALPPTSIVRPLAAIERSTAAVTGVGG